MHTLIHDGALGSSPAPIGKRIASAFAAFGGLCSLIPLFGWLAGIAELRGLGFARYPIWPLTALGYLALSAGFLSAIRGHRRLPRILWTLPLAIAGAAMLQTFAGIDFGIDRLLFGDSIATYPAAHPGRPGIGPSLTLVLLALAGYASRQQRWLRDEVSSLIASATLALGAAAVVLVLLSMLGGPQPFSALPGAIAAISLSIAFIAWNADFGWVRLLSSHRTDWQSLRLLVPLVLLFPLFPLLLAFLILPADSHIPLGSQAAIVIGNILIVALVAYGAVVRVARGQAATVELAQALDSATVALADLDGTILHWSRGCEQLYGWSSAEAVGRNKYALLHARCQQLGAPGLPRSAGSGTQALIETRRDGTEVSVLERVYRVETPGRAPVMALSMSDVSQTAAAMAALRASEERLAVAAAAHELGIFEWDVVSGRLDWSPGTEQRLGIVPGTITDFESWRAAMEPEDVENILDTIARAVADRADRFSFRFRFLQPNATVRAVEGSSRTYYDDDGNLIRTVGVFLNITEREEREAALRRREAQLRSILQTVPDAMVVIDGEGLIREFSAAAEALWGYGAAEVLGRSFTMLIPADLRERYANAVTNYLEKGEGGFLTAVVLGTGEAADGRRFPIEIRTGLASSDDHTLFTIFFRDISERLASEERLSELSGELAHVSRQSAMSELAADIAHELNQPLSATANFLAAARMLIEKGEEMERVAELLRMGGEQTQRAGQIIRRMRDFTARREVDMRAEPVAQTVCDAAELVLVGTGQFHIRLSYDFDPEAHVVLADRVQIQQVLVNLLRNSMQALRARPSGSRAIIIASRKIDERMVEISVSDSGPGIPQPALDELFTRFTTTKGNKGGMGIGLSISKRIIEAHGGTLSAENRPEGGAVFRFTLPAGEGEEA